VTFTFPAAVAWDPIGKQAVKNTSFQVFTVADTGFVTPLAITDTFGAALPGNILNSGTQGVFPEFKDATESTVVITDPTRTYVWTVNAVMQDASVAAYVGSAGSATQLAVKNEVTAGATATALNSTYAPVSGSANYATPASVTAAVAPKADTTALTSHTGNVANPHAVTKAQVGLGNADNTADTAKPVSTAQATAIALKLDVTTAATTYDPLTIGGKGTVRKDEVCVSVLDYGAVADGNLTTGAGTDNTTAFNNAVTAAKAANRRLYIPGGVYRTTDMIDIRGTRTHGDGVGITTVMCTDNTKGIVLVGGSGQYLADMTLRHWSAPDSGTISVPNGVGVRMHRLADRSVIERVHCYNVTSGFYQYEPYGADATNYMFSTSIRDCRVDRFSHSIMTIRGYSAGNTGNVIQNIYGQNGNGDSTYGTSTYGYFFETWGEGIMQQLNAEWGYYSTGVAIADCSNLTIQSVHFEQYRAKATTFNAFFNVYGSLTYTLRLSGVTLKDCIFDQANVPDYAIMRCQSGSKVTFDGLVSTGATVVGSVTRRKFVFSPVGAQVKASNFRLPDSSFQTADYYQSAVTTPGLKLANNLLGDGDLYEESEGLKWMTKTGLTYTLIGGDITSTSSNYTASAKDSVILATGGAGGITVTLPAVIKGGRYKVKKVDAGAGAVTVATTSSQTIDGATTKSLAAQYDSLSVASDGTAWFIV
jgi:hypothetical protein